MPFKKIAILLAFCAALASPAMAQVAPLAAPSASTLVSKLTTSMAKPNFAVIAVCNAKLTSCKQFKQDIALTAATIQNGWTGPEIANSAEYYQLDATSANVAALTAASVSLSDSGQKAAVLKLRDALKITAASTRTAPLLIMINRTTGAVSVIKNATVLNNQMQEIRSFLKR